MEGDRHLDCYLGNRRMLSALGWRVTSQLYPRFLYDSEKFNEWMNPIDYEPEGQDDEGTVGSGKRGAEQQGGGDSKRQRLGNEEQLPEIMPGEGSEVCAGVVKRTVGTPHPAAMDGSPRTQNLSQGQYNKEPEEVPQLAKSGAIFAPPITTSEQPATPARPEEMVEVYRVPVHASWFKWNKIHDIERRGVPEFFNGRSSRKTPEVHSFWFGATMTPLNVQLYGLQRVGLLPEAIWSMTRIS